MRRRLALAGLLADLLAAPAGAQGVRVAGVVHDSVAATPLAGAVVQLVPAGAPGARVRAARTDSLGRWALDSLAPGRWLGTFIHARLDSLGVAAPEYLLGVGGSMDGLVFAVPGAARVVRAHCPAAADGTGALLGRLRDAGSGAPVAGAAVAGEWRELVVGAGGARWEPQRSRAASGVDGWFALCGLPPGGEVALRAARGADTLALALAVPASGLVARDLYVGRVAARLTGVVRTTEGRPLAGARVTVVGVAHAAVTDTAGRWALDGVPGGTRVLETRGIGYAPDRRVLDVVADPPPPPQDVALVSLRTLLDTVRIGGTRQVAALRRFEERRRRLGAGRFLDSAQIAGARPLRALHVLERIPGMSVVWVDVDGRRVYAVRARGGGGFEDSCMPVLFIDGVRVPVDDLQEIDALVDVSELAGVELYQPGTAPQEFTTLTGCATILVWTNRRR